MKPLRSTNVVLQWRLFLKILPFANYRFHNASLFDRPQAEEFTVLTSSALSKSHGRLLPGIIRAEITLLHRQEWGTPGWLSRLL